jgi:5-methylcytosine-specific restriction endonuclease McrA
MSVLVLNSSFLPIQTTSVKKAIKMIYRGVATVEKYSSTVWKSVSSEVVLPAVIRLLNFYKLPIRTHRLSKKNIFLRDQYLCQYCGEQGTDRSLTVDHVMPKSRGGTSKWDNLVSSCKGCNTKKGNKTPEEAGMRLLTKPAKAGLHTQTTLLRNKGINNPEWSEFLFN